MAKENTVNFDELKKDATKMTTVVDESEEKTSENKTTEEKKSDDTSVSGLIISDEDVDENVSATEDEDTSKTYDGPGVVVDKPLASGSSDAAFKVGPMANKERVDSVKKTVADMDEEILEQHKKFMEITKNGSEVPAKDAVGNEKEVTVLIDKLGLGTVQFTEDEKKRIEHSKKIRLVEVTNKELQSIKIKKTISKSDEFDVIKKTFDKSLSPVIALASGYTGKMGNVSAAEAIRLIQRPGKDTANSILEKWSLIYDKLKDVSIGAFESFDDFISRTAFIDYNAFLYAILCSSYPESDSVTFNCVSESCKKNNPQFVVEYDNKNLIRTDLIGEPQKLVMGDIIENAAFLDKAKEIAEKAPVNKINRMMLNDNSRIIVDVYLPSVKEEVERLFSKIEDNEDLTKDKNRQALLIGHNLKSIFIPDLDSDDGSGDVEYYEVTGIENIVETVNKLNENQLRLITSYIDKVMNPYTIQFGLKEVVCPHCHRNYGEYSMDLDQVLFQRVQQRVATEYESENSTN